MKKIAILTLACLLGMGANMLEAQQTSTTQTNPTQNKDIPRQEPGTNNPDLAQQRHKAPKSGTAQNSTSSKKRTHHRKQSPNTAGSTKH